MMTIFDKNTRRITPEVVIYVYTAVFQAMSKVDKCLISYVRTYRPFLSSQGTSQRNRLCQVSALTCDVEILLPSPLVELPAASALCRHGGGGKRTIELPTVHDISASGNRVGVVKYG